MAEERKDGAGGGQIQTLERDKSHFERPRLYRVILHNDDYTTMEFVIEVLMNIFRKGPEEAARLMLLVHHSGLAAVGVYSLEIAETKCRETETLAREKGFPLKVTVEIET